LSAKSQFGLFKLRRFLPLFVTQFLGAFNDNLLRAALVAIFTFTVLVSENHEDIYVIAAQGLLSLPFFLFSATAGTLADYFEKSRLITYVKYGEVVIAFLIALAFWSGQPLFMLGLLFLLGTQSAFFAPLKYSILPQHLDSSEIVGGNGVVQMGTFVAILLGTIIGTQLVGTEPDQDVAYAVPYVLAVFIIFVAVAGLIASYFIPKARSHLDSKPRWNPITVTRDLLRIASERRSVMRSILGVAWFWSLGAVYLAQLPNLTEDYLYSSKSVLTLLLSVVTISIALGSLTCEKLSRKHVEMGLVPIGAFFISVIGIELFFAINAVPETAPRTVLAFLQTPSSYRVLIEMVFLGFFMGIYVVPLQTLVQVRTSVEKRARVIAAMNVMNAFVVVCGALWSLLWLHVIGWDIPGLFLFMSIFNACVSVYIFLQVPEFTMRFVVWVLSHSMYRVRHEGIDLVPESGGALIACNHVSYIDALILAGAVRRPIRFVMAKDVYDMPFLNYLFRACRTIPIAPKSVDPHTYDKAFEDIEQALEEGDLLCIFPEGRLTPDGKVGEFKSGIMKVLEKTPVPVVPAALKGLWGMKFTHHGDGLFRGSWKLRSKLGVALSAPVEGPDVNLYALQREVVRLRGAYQ